MKRGTATARSAAIVAGLVLLVLIVSVSRQGEPIAPVSDTAVLESYTVAASRAELLVGPYSRYAWHHPGPLYLYLLVPFYSLSGKVTLGLGAGALAINLAALGLIAWIVTTAAGGVFGATVMGLIALYTWRIAPMLASPWNPHVIVLPAVALIVLTASVVSGWVALLPLVAVVATFITQTHLGSAPYALTLSAAALASTLLAARSPERRSSMLATAIVALAVAVVLWAPAFWEEMTRTPGNITRLWTFFFAGPHAGQPFKDSYGAWVDALSGFVRPGFRLAEGSVFRRSRTSWAEAWVLAQMALLLVSAVLAVRANRRFQAALAILLLVASLVGLWSVTQIEGEIVDHDVFWLSGLGALGLATVFGSAFSEVLNADTPPLRWAPAICAGAFAIVAVLGVQQLWLRAHAPARLEQVAATKFGAALARRIRATGHKPLIRIDQDAWPVAAGVVASLTKAGLAFAVEDDWLPMFTESAKATGSEDEVVSIVERKRFATLDGASQMATVAAQEPYYMLAGERGAR